MIATLCRAGVSSAMAAKLAAEVAGLRAIDVWLLARECASATSPAAALVARLRGGFTPRSGPIDPADLAIAIKAGAVNAIGDMQIEYQSVVRANGSYLRVGDRKFPAASLRVEDIS